MVFAGRVRAAPGRNCKHCTAHLSHPSSLSEAKESDSSDDLHLSTCTHHRKHQSPEGLTGVTVGDQHRAGLPDRAMLHTCPPMLNLLDEVTEVLVL